MNCPFSRSRGDPHPLHQLYAAPLPLTLALDDSPTALLKSMADSATGSMTTSTTTLPRADLQQILVDLPVLSKLHAAVRSAMERARQGGDKTSGTGFLTSSTQTDVVVRLPSSREAASLVAMLRRWGEQELEDMWVVARVRVVVDDMPAVSTENVENPVDVDGRDSPVSTEPFDTGKDGITGVVEVRRTDMGKCSRCWRHVLDEKTPKQDDICGRCAEAVAETQA